MFSDDLDSVANEMEQGFQQRGGRKACRYLLGKIVEEERERLREEKKRRVYYQNIVYQCCNALDGPRHCSTSGGSLVCGTIEEPQTEVQDAVQSVCRENEHLAAEVMRLRKEKKEMASNHVILMKENLEDR